MKPKKACQQGSITGTQLKIDFRREKRKRIAKCRLISRWVEPHEVVTSETDMA